MNTKSRILIAAKAINLLLLLSISSLSNASIQTYSINETYACVLGSCSTFNGTFNFNTITNLITNISGNLYDGVVFKSLTLDQSTLSSIYYPPSTYPPETVASIATYAFTDATYDTYKDVYRVAIVSNDQTVFWSLPNNTLYRDNLTYGTYSQSNVTSYNISLVSSPPPSNIPIPASIWLFGSALTSFGLIGKRRVA